MSEQVHIFTKAALNKRDGARFFLVLMAFIIGNLVGRCIDVWVWPTPSVVVRQSFCIQSLKGGDFRCVSPDESADVVPARRK